jgi:DNA polymerase-1
MFKAFPEEAERIMHIRDMGQTPLTNTAEQLARLLMTEYDKKFPMVTEMLNSEMEKADVIGEVRTELGRRITFDHNRATTKSGLDTTKMNAYKKNQRFGSYKALNYYNQGTAADIMKAGMVKAYEEGIFDEDRLGMPHLTVHDELDLSYHPDMYKELMYLKEAMENAIELSVPIIVDVEVGKNWGSVKELKNSA